MSLPPRFQRASHPRRVPPAPPRRTPSQPLVLQNDPRPLPMYPTINSWGGCASSWDRYGVKVRRPA